MLDDAQDVIRRNTRGFQRLGMTLTDGMYLNKRVPMLYGPALMAYRSTHEGLWLMTLHLDVPRGLSEPHGGRGAQAGHHRRGVIASSPRNPCSILLFLLLLLLPLLRGSIWAFRGDIQNMHSTGVE